MKRILAIFITLCMLITCVPFAAMAEDQIIGGTFKDEQGTPNTFTWSLNLTTGALAIDGKGAMTIVTENPWDVSKSTTLIPWAYYGEEKTDYRSAIKSISIGSGITSLGRELFYGCTSLEEVTVPGNISHSGWGLFMNCTSLKKATLAEGFKDTGDKIFMGCTALTELNLPNSLSLIRQNIVQGCTSLKTLTLPAGLTFIHQNAFGDNKGGTDGAAVIPAPAGNIGHSIAFTVYADTMAEEYIETYYPDSLSEVTEGKVVATGDIDGGAAEDTGITWTVYETNKLVLARTKNANGTYVGTGKMPNNADGGGSMPWEASYSTTITSAEIGEGIIYVGNRIFQSHSALKSVKMADTVTSMGTYVFNSCTTLTTVEFSETLSNIPNGTFNRCYAMGEVVIPYGTTFTGNAFYRIGSGASFVAFKGSAAATALQGDTDGLTINITHMGPGGKSETTSGLPLTIKTLGGKVVSENGSINWTLENGILNVTGSGKMCNLNQNATDQPWYYVRTNITEAYIGAGITYVGDRYFQECKELTKVEMADTVTSLGSYLFNACAKLASVKLSRSITGGGDYLLYQVPSLPAITIPLGMNVTAKTLARSGPDTVITIYAGGVVHKEHPDLTITGIQNYDKTTGNTRTFTLGYETENGTDGTTTWAWDYAKKTITIGGTGATTSWHTDANAMGSEGWHMNRGYFHYATIAEKVVIGKDITAIGDYAFMQFTALKELEFEEGSALAKLGIYAFSNTRLAEVTLPESVELVMNCAFRASSETDTDTHTLTKLVVTGDDTVLYDTALARQSKVVVYCNYGSKAYDFAVNGDIDYYLLDVDYHIADYSKATKTAKILNSTGASKAATVIFANLDGDEITHISIVPATLNEGINEITASADFAPTKGNITVYLWDNMDKITPLAKSYMKNTVWMLGDSIMADWPDARYPQEGWGEAFKDVVTENLVVKNRAISGYTAETCYNKIWSTNQARSDWNPVRDEVCAGDYVIIAYLHNDYCAVADPSKNNGLYQNTEYINEYRNYIETIADECAEKGAQIILVVPPNRGELTNFHNRPVNGVDVGDYSAVIPAIAEERGLPCVNIHKWTLEEANKDEAFLDTIYLTKNYIYDLIEKGEFTEEALNNHSNSGLAKNHNDHTHLSILGCKNVAEYVASQLKTMDCGIEYFLK